MASTRTLVRCELVEHGRELAAQESRLDTGAPSEALEVRARRRIAIDGDEAALAAQVAREQLGMTTGAERRVDDGVAGLDVEQPPHLVGEHRDVISRAWRKAFGNILRPPFSVCDLGAPRGAIPDLEMVVNAGDDDVALEPGVGRERRRDQHAALPVRCRLRGAGEEVSLDHAVVAAEWIERRSGATRRARPNRLSRTRRRSRPCRGVSTRPSGKESRNFAGSVSRPFSSSVCSCSPRNIESHRSSLVHFAPL